MADAELIEQIRAQVKSLKSPRHATPGRGTTDTTSSGGSSRGRLTTTGLGPITGRTSSANNSRTPSTPTAMNDSTIVLDVGGVKYRTTALTLKCIESSYFSHLLNGAWDPPRTEEGHIFIDRNGQLFAVVLEYLRNCVHNDGDFLDLAFEVSKLKALKREADFYLLPGLVTLINTVLQEHKEKDRFQLELDTTSSVVVKEEEDHVEKEFDLIFQSIANSQCAFSEDRIQDLMNRVNYSLSLKEAEGYKINSSSSDLIFDPMKTCPYIIFIQIMLVRDRKPQDDGFQLPASTPPLERARPMHQQLPMSPYIHPESCDLGSNEGVDFLGPSRRPTPPRSPRTERQFSNNHRYQQPGDLLPDNMYSSQVNDHPRCNPRWNYRPRFADQGEWEGNYEVDQQTIVSPRGAGHYQPSSHHLQRKASNRSPLTQSNSYKYLEDAVSARGGGRNDGWVNQASSVQ